MRRQSAKPGQVVVWYGKLDKHDKPDLCVAWGGDGAGSSDGRLFFHILKDIKLWDWGTDMLQELEKRGYDLNTLKISIQQKSPRQPEEPTG